MPDRPSWLCPTPNDRERFLDMQERLGFARVLTIVMGVVIMVPLVPRGGLPLVLVVSTMVAVVLLGAVGLERRERPELWIFATTVLNIQLSIAASVLLTGGPRTPLAATLAMPVLMMGSRFSTRGLIVGTPISAALAILTTLGAAPGYVAHHPDATIVPLSLILVTAGYLVPLVDSDVRHRTDSTLDELTGLLNRRALMPRFREVAAQAAADGQPVSVVVMDIDHFKAINDEHGHAAGDLVLRHVSHVMRHTLRTFELLYRVGGEEFLLLLPGAGTDDAGRIAESMRRAVARLNPLGVAVTCSFGVATARGADTLDLAQLTKAADGALYRAKRHGRNRVEFHDSPAPASAA